MITIQAIKHPTIIITPRHGIISANQAVLDATALSEQDIIGKKCYEIFHHNTKTPPENSPLEKFHNSGRIENYEGEVEALGGTFHVNCAAVFFTGYKNKTELHYAKYSGSNMPRR